MRPLLVVFDKPGLGDLAYLREGLKHVGTEHFLAIGLVEPLDESVLVRLAGLDEAQLNGLALAPLGEGNRGELASIVQPESLRLAVKPISCSITRITRRLGIEVATSVPSTSRLPSSMTLNVRNRRPS